MATKKVTLPMNTMYYKKFATLLYVLLSWNFLCGAEATIKIQTKDNDVFEIDIEAAKTSSIIAHLLDDLKDNATIVPLPDITGDQFETILPFLYSLQQNKLHELEHSLEELNLQKLAKILVVANFLEVKILYTKLLEAVAVKLKSSLEAFSTTKQFIGDLALSDDVNKAVADVLIDKHNIDKFFLYKLLPPKPALRTVLDHRGVLEEGSFSKDNSLIITRGGDGTNVCTYSIVTGTPGISFDHEHVIRVIRCNSTESTVAVGCSDGSVHLWNLKTGRHIRAIAGEGKSVTALCFDRPGNNIAIGYEDGIVKVCKIQTGFCIGVYKGRHTTHIKNIYYSADNKLITIGTNGPAWMWNSPTECAVCFEALQGAVVIASSINSSGTLLALASYGGTVIWDLVKKERYIVFPENACEVSSVCFSYDSDLVATTNCQNTEVRIYSVKTGELKNIIKNHHAWVDSVSFSPHGSLLATGSHDKTVCLWNTETKQQLYNFSGHTNALFSLDGSLMAVSGNKNSAQVYQILNDSLREYFRKGIMLEQVLLLLLFIPIIEKNGKLSLCEHSFLYPVLHSLHTDLKAFLANYIDTKCSTYCTISTTISSVPVRATAVVVGLLLAARLFHG